MLREVGPRDAMVIGRVVSHAHVKEDGGGRAARRAARASQACRTTVKAASAPEPESGAARGGISDPTAERISSRRPFMARRS